MSIAPFGHLSRTELAERAGADAILIVPLGATEQHGPHLPTWVDSAIIERLSDAAAERADVPCPIVVAPVLPFGSSDHHLPFGGTLSIATQTYLAMLMDIGRSAASSGFRRILYLNGHGGNHELAILAARDVSLTEEVHAAAGSWWTLAAAELARWADNRGVGFVPGHAGALETSIALTLFPELVGQAPQRSPQDVDGQAQRRDTRMRVEFTGGLRSMQGYTDDPASASAAPDLVDAIIDAIAHEIEHFELHSRTEPHIEREKSGR